MFTRLRVALLAPAMVALLALPAAAQQPAADRPIPRFPLDWEPDPNDISVPVVANVLGKPRIVALKGGKKIRPRVRRAL